MTTGDDLLAACAEEPENTVRFLVAADWFDEYGPYAVGTALRWMVKWDQAPHKTTDKWMWTSYGGLCGAQFKCGVRHTLPRALCRRMKFHEWRCYKEFREAVYALAEGLLEGPVECIGDPEQVDEL